ncbi:hypothetical protein B0T14DRAFT_522618 [Immersiella caudata]|uniref:Fucose-specific lectin n=1 Tax=Immersiella caudata TaxID=314043 RepID=A0AA39WSZ7_9PEZI|nr:hypothetical protein B0T14DRAFT_522618 [Immersiella caudata]
MAAPEETVLQAERDAGSSDAYARNLEGRFNRMPIVLSRAPDHTDVLHIGLNSKLYVKSRNGNAFASFGKWDNISGTQVSYITGVCSDSNRADVFATNAENNLLLQKTYMSGGWKDFQVVTVNGDKQLVNGEVSAATAGPDTLYLFYRNMTNWIVGIWWNRLQNCWTNIELNQDWAFHSFGTPRVVAFNFESKFRLDVFARDMSNQVVHKTLSFTDPTNPVGSGTWIPAGAGWEVLSGGPVIDDVSAVQTFDARGRWHIHLFSRNASNRIVRRSLHQGDKTWMPTDNWDVSWACGGSPVQVVADATKITAATTGDWSVVNVAEFDMTGDLMADWIRVNVGAPEGLQTLSTAVLHPRGGPRGWLQQGNSEPLEVFLKGADGTLHEIFVRQENLVLLKKTN